MKRRTFLTGTAVAGAAVGMGFCAVASGVIIDTLGDRAKNVAPTVVHVEGDPRS